MRIIRRTDVAESLPYERLVELNSLKADTESVRNLLRAEILCNQV